MRSRLDSEDFSGTFNDEASSGIEIGTASVRENADEGSFIATATFHQNVNKNPPKKGLDQVGDKGLHYSLRYSLYCTSSVIFLGCRLY